MRVVIVGGTSSLGSALKTALSTRFEVITAGRTNCDLEFDLTWPLARMALPEEVDVVVHTAAHFGGKTAADPANVFPGDDALYQAIHFRPSTTIEDGLRRIATLS